MTMTDPVADFLTRLRNASKAHHESLSVPYSQLKGTIADILKAEGYIDSYKVEDAKRREAEAAMLATASPADLGKKAYTACAACHGLNGEGGVGPKLQGQTKDAIVSMLTQYKNGETRGAQSALMWGQAAALSADDMANIGAFVETL